MAAFKSHSASTGAQVLGGKNRSARPSPKQEREVVAELGGAVLLECLGYETESDRGGAWDYIQEHSEAPNEAFRLCTDLLDRTCAAVSLILRTAAELEAPGTTQMPKLESSAGPSAVLSPAPTASAAGGYS